MASLEVDQKYLGKLAKTVEADNPLLASILFKILGLSINLSAHTVKARKQRRLEHTSRPNQSLELYLHIIWLAREGALLLEQYVIPMVGLYVELKVLAYKLRASFYHIFVQFHNHPPVTKWDLSTPETQATATVPELPPQRIDKGKGIAKDGDIDPSSSSEGGPVGPPPGFGPESPAAFLMPAVDYLPHAHGYFKEAVTIADQLLWGSHSLRLSVKTEYAAFLYECVHDAEASRAVAKNTIGEVYDATEGIDNDMFNDACNLVAILGKMMKRGLGSNNTLRSRGQGSSSGTQGTPKAEAAGADNGAAPPGMI
ncbi:14-3-3 protein [Coniochaeta ligniaria NRRL 30616]|uniref:14-3-3 protein n=1 Tax=Coniochaeta ligniaria NRRL 30616 TaxID=1408157 RepID=A0A1J7JKM5_9PEZI|nr:14-3-3 protein [Coniochaeta ligniaria NRRL 30616]